MNKRPMPNGELFAIIVFIILFLYSLFVTILDNEVPIGIKIFVSIIFVSMILYFLIKIIVDLKLRRKFKNNQMITSNEHIEEISADEWNYNQLHRLPSDRNTYNEEINEMLGEKISFLKRTDKYGNVTLEAQNNNLLDWVVVFIFGNLMNFLMVNAFFNGNTNLITLIFILLIFTPVIIYSMTRIKKIKQMNLKISFFQIFKTIFTLYIIVFVMGGFFIIGTDFDIKQIDLEKLIFTLFYYIMIIGTVLFVYQLIVVFIVGMNKKKSK